MLESVAARNALLTALGHLAERMAAATTPAEVLSALADGARGLLPFTACALALHDSEVWHVWRAAAARPDEVSFNDAVPPAAAETLQRFLEHGQLLRIDDLLAPPWGESTHRDVLWKDGTRSALLVPLKAGGGKWGALSFTATQPDRYGPADRDGALLLAWMVAATLRALPSSHEPIQEDGTVEALE